VQRTAFAPVRLVTVGLWRGPSRSRCFSHWPTHRSEQGRVARPPPVSGRRVQRPDAGGSQRRPERPQAALPGCDPAQPLPPPRRSDKGRCRRSRCWAAMW